MVDTLLRKALDDYKNIYMPHRNFAVRTRVEYSNDLKDLVVFLENSGAANVKDLKLPHIERYLAELERRGFVSATRKRKTATIRSFLTFLYKDSYIQSNIAKHVVPPFLNNKPPAFFTKAEYDRLRRVCSGNMRDTAIIELLLQTGIRLSELTRLIVDDIEPSEDGCFIRIRGRRGRKERLLPLSTKTCQTIISYLQERPETGDSLLFLNRFGKPFGDRGIQKMVRKYLKNAAVERGSINTLRHTFGTRHIARGTNLRTVQEIMALKDVRSVLIYQTLTKEVVSR